MTNNHEPDSNENNLIILTAITTAQLNLYTEDQKLHFELDRMKLITQTKDFMDAQLALIEEAASKWGVELLVTCDTVVSLEGENQSPFINITTPKEDIPPALPPVIAAMCLIFAERVCGVAPDDLLSSHVPPEIDLDLVEQHAEQFLMRKGNLRVTSDFSLSSPLITGRNLVIQGRYAPAPEKTERRHVTGVAAPAGLSVTGNTISLLIDEKEVKMHINDTSLLVVCAEAILKRKNLKYTAVKISQPLHRDIYELSELSMADAPDEQALPESAEVFYLQG